MNLLKRFKSKWRRELSSRLFRRSWNMQNREPLISFTFDDFPASALHTAGAILSSYGIAGTYYASFGLMDTLAPTGRIFSPGDIPRLLESGHELGCHTYHHRHSFDTPPRDFEASVNSNREALERLAPGERFRTLSYPISGPRPGTKRRCARLFAACRFGGQAVNQGEVDLSALSAFFLEQSRDNFAAVERIIAQTANTNGWLIFATHDVARDPTPFGVTPKFFEDVVRTAVASGVKMVSVSQGLRRIGRGEDW
jgi:peptidoglycan/xylan/chitin deacetylase (PgdA/CDA1 family)